MTVTTSLNYKEYQADGMVTKFAIPFLLLDRSDLYVFINNQLITTGYTVTGLGNPISEIIFEDAPEGVLLLQRSITLIRETDYQENGDLLAKTVNQDFDRIYLALQGVAQDTTKALRVADAEGVRELPLANERANKNFSFDNEGQPILTTTATGSAAELAQRLVDASSESRGSGLVGYNKTLNYPTRTIGNALNTLTDRFDGFEGNGVPMFAVFWWPSRTNIPNGYIAADGQELSQAMFPDAAIATQQGKVPTVQELEWQMDPLKRGSYVANSSQGKFRVPDYNGKYADSVGALFLRGDNNQVANGYIQQDAMQGHKHAMVTGGTAATAASTSVNGGGPVTTGIAPGGTNYTGQLNLTTDMYAYNDYGVLKIANETRPINVSGCWVIKLFGYVINTSEADIQQLITENANLAARLSVLESYQQAKKFTIIYPNDGTEENPANVVANKRYIMANPFPNEPVVCDVQLLVNGSWANPGWLYSNGGQGIRAGQLEESGNIVVQTGSSLIANTASWTGGLHNNTGNIASANCRVKVWRVI